MGKNPKISHSFKRKLKMNQNPMDLKSPNGLDQDLPGVILIVIDGCTSDGLQKAATPNIDGIVNNGLLHF